MILFIGCHARLMRLMSPLTLPSTHPFLPVPHNNILQKILFCCWGGGGVVLNFQNILKHNVRGNYNIFLLQLYEVCVESTLQLFLQFGIILFKIFLTFPGSYEFLDESSYYLDIISITTSTFAIIWGLSSYKINVTQTEQKICDKFVLMVRSSVDIIARLKH